MMIIKLGFWTSLGKIRGLCKSEIQIIKPDPIFDVYLYIPFSFWPLPSVFSFVLSVQNCILLVVETLHFRSMWYAVLISGALKERECVKAFLPRTLCLLFTRTEGEKRKK